MHQQQRLTRTDHIMLQILLLVSTLLAGYVLFTLFTVSQTDYPNHVRFAIRIAENGILDFPHILYHALLIALAKLLPALGYISAGLIVCLAFYVATPLILYRIIRPNLSGTGWRPSLLALLVSAALMLVSHINLFSIEQQNIYFGYIAINVYHNPTMTLLKPLALLAFTFAVAVLQNRLVFTPGVMIKGIILMALCMLAKPNYLISLLPALLLVGAYKIYRRESISWRVLLISIIIPTSIIIVIQYLMTFADGQQAGIIFAPLLGLRAWLEETPVIYLGKLFLSTLFPLCVYILHWKDARKNLALNVCWLTFIVGIVQLYFFAETGSRLRDGNFWWSGQITLFVLFVFSTVFLLQQSRKDWRWWICAGAFVLHLVSGILFLSITLLYPDQIYDWW